ncbi:transcription-repair coupling factor [Litoribrevibacter albus]|uniref:Transcription-repair-coupling factor n=1 Tax=Litoribrevibacter albus TaxID=1473156 RepID=A0AA37W6T2_9GAMM|nr:transcription-repair coupling factor [Litoribrevibacter albus]GLQ30299.1 transcription-repair-coupling factor [Litoribrevibacter albus]
MLFNSADLIKEPQSSDHKRYGNVVGSSAALLIAQTLQKVNGFGLVITDNNSQANILSQELEFFSQGNLPVLNFPDWETLPYDTFSPHQDIISERLKTLNNLGQTTQGVLVISAQTLMQKVPPNSFIGKFVFSINVGSLLKLDRLKERLAHAGYQHVDTVYEHGEFSIRGSIIDLFPMGHDLPYRIELFDDEIESVRSFDPESQRSIDKFDQVNLLPAREFPCNEESLSAFRKLFRETFEQSHKAPLLKDLQNNLIPSGIEYYQPLFFQASDNAEMSSLVDYLPKNTCIFSFSQLNEHIEKFWNDIDQRFESLRYDIERPILPPAELYLRPGDLLAQIKSFQRISLSENPIEEQQGRINLPVSTAPDLSVDHRLTEPYSRIIQFSKDYDGTVVLIPDSPGRRETLAESLKAAGVSTQNIDHWKDLSFTEKKTVQLLVAPLAKGVLFDTQQLAIITEQELFGFTVSQRRRTTKTEDHSDQVIKNLTELKMDAPVVHLDHGVGRYRGLETIELDGQANEFLILEYADNAKLYVPVNNLHMIARYTGADDEHAPINKLGSERWSQAKRKAAEKARDTAVQLLDIYARRAAKKGFMFELPDESYRQFSAGFPFEETPDQAQAINAVIQDMHKPNPMDRLVCGDVGFGKTEVAMRAAFVAVQSGKQVAVLVPTTLLAQQHYESFRDRFAEWPVKVDVLSRFKTTKEQNTALQQLEEGKIDILVGTHKIIQGDVKFKDLGLLIIDEEHRFGVQQKEKLKSLRSDIDILTLTATPIPRTLNMSMSGIRDLSIIATPPAKRLSVKTFVRQKDDVTMREALLRELLRGGQAYVLHNEVKTIEKVTQDIRDLMPEARVEFAHGQMRESELERIMSDFYHRRFNILVCTTIIETGIDVPNANTIIIERADKFGLAQLHQLRGRVGRSHHQAYAYLMTPPPRSITKDAVKRLEAISAADTLGAGFTLATHDLEIRGAGELLGEDQSGQIEGVGFTLYMELLEDAVKSIKEGKEPNLDKPLQQSTEVNLKVPALIPNEYLPDIHERLIIYKRISNASDKESLHDLKVELVDRFGLLPDATKNLFRLTELRFKAESLGITKIEAGPKSGKMNFASDTSVDTFKIVTMMQSQPQKYRLQGGNQLQFTLDMDKTERRFQAVDALLNELAPKE